MSNREISKDKRFGAIADEIIDAYLNAKPFKWTTWDSWGGRVVYHQRDTKRDAIVDILDKYWPK